MKTKDEKKLIELWEFLDADMPSKIFPHEKLKGEIWSREDKFIDIKEVGDYLTEHFLIAFPELNKTQSD